MKHNQQQVLTFTEGLDIAAIRARPTFFQGQAYRLMSKVVDLEIYHKILDIRVGLKTYEKNPEAAEMNENHLNI